MPRRTTALLAAATAAVATLGLVVAAPAGAEPVPGGAAPGAPGAKATWSKADKHGFGTAYGGATSRVWFTLREGEVADTFYPDLGTPALRDVEFVVVGQRGYVKRSTEASSTTAMPDAKVPAFTQTDTAAGRWTMVRRYVTDPARSTVLVDVEFRSLDGRPYQVYVVADPNLTNAGDDDTAAVAGKDVVASDGTSAMSLSTDIALADRTVGYLGTSDARTDLLADGDLDHTYASAGAGNVVLAGRLAGVTGVGTARTARVALGFGGSRTAAAAAAHGSLSAGFAAAATSYAAGWHGYFAGLKPTPDSAGAPDLARAYDASVVASAASEDKANPGAYIASPSMPWVWGQEIEGLSKPSGAYHLVWSRDLYQIATALIAAGDTAGANRSLDFLFTKQQKADGSFPQNSDVRGTPVWGDLQLDEVAFPLVLAWQLGRTDATTYSHVKRAADFLVNFTRDDGGVTRTAPWSPQERWENQSGYSPATIASEIAGLICAAQLAEANGDQASADRWRSTAHAWADQVDDWTVTTTGPYDPKPYYLRLTKNGDPDSGVTYNVGDGGGTYDQRAVVDPSFLELVRLGVKPADDPVVANTVAVVDDQLGVDTPNGTFWHRFTDDGYGETATGDEWRLGTPGEQATIGRIWPIFAGERGEYELLAGGGDPQGRLQSMADAGNDGLQIAEQVWDENPPSGQPGFPRGEGTFSATPLIWSHAQLVRLAWSIDAGEPVERPSVVSCELLGQGC